MHPTKVTLILLAIAAVLVAAVPSIREGIDKLFIEGVLGYPDKLPSPSEVERIVERHPDDAQLALGRAEYLAGVRAANRRVTMEIDWGVQEDTRTRLARAMPSSLPSEQDVAEAYELAVSRSDSDPVVVARQALWLLPPFLEDVYIPSDPSEAPPQPTADQRARIGTARPKLQHWSRREPRNGTPSVMIAWTHAAEGRMDPSLHELARLEQATRWETYEGYAWAAALDLLSDAGREATTRFFVTAEPGANSKTRWLVRAIAAEAHRRRETGWHGEAVRRYVATLRMATLLTDSAQGMDFLTAGSAFAIAAAHDAPPFPEEATREQVAAHTREAMRGLAQYLRRHGAGDTADRALAALRVWQDRRKQFTDHLDAERAEQWRIAGSPSTSNLRIIWWTLAALTGLTIIGGIAALVLRPRETYTRLHWRWSEWLILVMILAIPIQLWFAFVAEPAPPPDAREPGPIRKLAGLFGDYPPVIPLQLQWAADEWLPPATLAAGVWIVAAGVALRRRRGGGEHDVAAPYVLRDLLRLAAPTLALLVLLSALAAAPMYTAYRERSHEKIERQVEGDLVYYGIMQTQDAEATSE